MLEALVWIQFVALVVGVPLLFLYLKERVKNLAREESDKVLADYRHQHEEALAATNAEHGRRLEEFGLYARKRHAVYPKLYAKYRQASDTYSSIAGFRHTPAFAQYEMEDAKEFMAKHDVPSRLAKPILEAYEAKQAGRARDLLQDLEGKLTTFRALQAFTQAKNIEATQELYLSDQVRSQLDIVRNRMAKVSVRADSDRDGKLHEQAEAMQTAMIDLYHLMRSELRRGEPAEGASAE